MRQAPRLVLSDDPDEARVAVASYDEELSRLGERFKLGNRTVQPRSFAREVTVIDPRRIRPLT